MARRRKSVSADRVPDIQRPRGIFKQRVFGFEAHAPRPAYSSRDPEFSAIAEVHGRPGASAAAAAPSLCHCCRRRRYFQLGGVFDSSEGPGVDDVRSDTGV